MLSMNVLQCFLFNDATVETRYNAVLGVHRSDPRYIRVDGYNAVCVPPTLPTNGLYPRSIVSYYDHIYYISYHIL